MNDIEKNITRGDIAGYLPKSPNLLTKKGKLAIIRNMKQSVSCFWNSAYNGVYGMKLDVLFSITIIFQKNSILSFLIAII